MFKKFKVLIVIASLAITLSLMSNTYSRYVANSQGNLQIEFAKWQLLVNNTDITSSTSSNITFKPTIEANNNVAANKIAPSSTGYFDVEIDPTNVDVSFKYTIDLAIDNTNIPDLIVTKYAIVPENYIEGNALEYKSLTDGTITNSNYYTSEGFKKFTVRVYFEWIENDIVIDENTTIKSSMDDAADTNVGNTAATENTTFKISANINFEQIIS